MRYLWLLLAVIMVAVIWGNSMMPGDESLRMSGMITTILTIIGDALSITFNWDVEHLVRKLAHFLEFAFLGWLLCRTYDEFHIGHRTSTGYIFFICLFVAVVDEYIQAFSPGRSSMVKDVLLDFSGAFCAWLSQRVWDWSKL